ncbi:hypothetical protein V6N13_094090 [Hibiscus sabdariffa]
MQLISPYKHMLFRFSTRRFIIFIQATGVLAFHSSPRWQLHFNSVKETPKLMVIDFSASWCGPCKFMEPVLNDMAARFTEVEFVKLDVDEMHDVAQEYGVQAMPTFVLLKKGKEVDRGSRAKNKQIYLLNH